VKGFWQTEGAPSYRVEYILPKGEVELIFSFADAAGYERAGAGAGRTPRCFVNGLSDTPVQLLTPPHQSFFGVVLHPAAVRPLLGAPAGVFLNGITDLEGVNRSVSGVWEALAACGSFAERVRYMEQWAGQRPPALHRQERGISAFLSSGDEMSTVRELAAHFCYSPRQLHRKVQELFGMAPEVLLRYKRYRQALDRVHHSRETLTRVAYACGYYDQAHFNREFRDYTGLTPGAYRREQSHLPGHLFR
jgi:AraC-like DNA-binding protein